MSQGFIGWMEDTFKVASCKAKGGLYKGFHQGSFRVEGLDRFRKAF